ncbi:hypothetical protein E3P99_01693 [Wallemia hederae]|uniref:Letm1 RBD domain-containing protein n=1 Tax=Wallemia hederae TaxID=1540922 RepID=A0A4T0FNS1_9BASI|nr:hypothetical protein E3P99_01693 [Wallemia hederae]
MLLSPNRYRLRTAPRIFIQSSYTRYYSSPPKKTQPQPQLTQAQKLDSLVLPPPPTDANFAGRWWHKGKTLVIFYWRGIKQIWFNREIVSEIKARQINNIDKPLTHREFQLIHTHQKDIKKLIPFAILFVLLEEVIPLIAYLAPQVLPSTVVLPSQKVSIRRAVEKRREEALKFYRDAYNDASRRQLENGLRNDSHTFQITADHVRIFLRLLDLSTLGTASMRHRRLDRYLQHISHDDKCILSQQLDKMDATAFLSEGEISDACSARGFLTLDVKDEQLTELLKKWLQVRESDTTNMYKPLHLMLEQPSSGSSNSSNDNDSTSAHSIQEK